MKKLYILIIILLLIFLAFLIWKCWFQPTRILLTQSEEELPRTYSVFDFKIPPITVPESMLVYQTLPPAIDTSFINKFSETFKLNSEIIEMDKYFFVKNGDKEAEIYKEPGTGLVKYTDFSQIGLEKNISNLPTPEEALNICQKFLTENEFISTGEELFSGSQYFEFAHFDNSGREIEKGKSSISVGFKYTIGDIPVEGPGAKTTITIGENRQIIEYIKMWREIEPYQTMKTIDYRTALIEFKSFWPPEASSRQMEQVSLLTNVIIEDIYLAYLTRTGSIPQKYLEPVFVFKGYFLIEGEHQERKIKSTEPFKYIVRAIKEPLD